jgi:hypothetical protein
MSKWRRAAKVDEAQAEIVAFLRAMPGVTVQTGVDDILVGRRVNGEPRTFWFEIKSQSAVSKKTGQVLESAKKASQKRLEAEWSGHYQVVSSIGEILQAIGISNG